MNIQNRKLALMALFLFLFACTQSVQKAKTTDSSPESETYAQRENSVIRINLDHNTQDLTANYQNNLLNNFLIEQNQIRTAEPNAINTSNSEQIAINSNTLTTDQNNSSTDRNQNSIQDSNQLQFQDQNQSNSLDINHHSNSDSNSNPNAETNANSGNSNPSSSSGTQSNPQQNSEPTPASQPNIFFDDFSGDLTNWNMEFTGYGRIWIENGVLNMKPQIALSPADNHAPLMTSHASWNNFILDFDQKTVQQLRQNTPSDPWEVAWIMFRYTDLQNYYYFIFKTNGVQLGKKQGSLTEQFLVTHSNPKLQLGQWNHIQIQMLGNRIQIFADGQKVIDYTDPNPLPAGKIGLYDEESWAEFDTVRVQPI